MHHLSLKKQTAAGGGGLATKERNGFNATWLDSAWYGDVGQADREEGWWWWRWW
jgi:hypothetical protein